MANLITPDCPLGYTEQQLRSLVGDSRWDEWREWSRGSTGVICDGREYDHETKQYSPTVCADSPHGPIVYVDNVMRFLSGLPNND